MGWLRVPWGWYSTCLTVPLLCLCFKGACVLLTKNIVCQTIELCLSSNVWNFGHIKKHCLTNRSKQNCTAKLKCWTNNVWSLCQGLTCSLHLKVNFFAFKWSSSCIHENLNCAKFPDFQKINGFCFWQDNHHDVAETAVVGYPHDIKGEGRFSKLIYTDIVNLVFWAMYLE